MKGCDFGLPWRRRETLDAVSLFHKEEYLRERDIGDRKRFSDGEEEKERKGKRERDRQQFRTR